MQQAAWVVKQWKISSEMEQWKKHEADVLFTEMEQWKKHEADVLFTG